MSQRRLPRAQRRQLLIDAAETLFARVGYASTRLEDVATASGVSKQLLQRHFASKSELLLAVLTRHRDGLLDRLVASDTVADLETRLRARTEGWFGYIQDNPVAAKLLFADVSGDPQVVAFHRESRDLARGAVAEMLQAEEGLVIDKSLLMPVAEMLRAGTVGLAVWWSDHPEIQRDQIVDLALNVWTGQLLANAQG